MTCEPACTRCTAAPSAALRALTALLFCLQPQVVVLLMLFSGFYINASTIPAALSWSEWGRGRWGDEMRCAASKARVQQLSSSLLHARAPEHPTLPAACSQVAEPSVLRAHGVSKPQGS